MGSRGCGPNQWWVWRDWRKQLLSVLALEEGYDFANRWAAATISNFPCRYHLPRHSIVQIKPWFLAVLCVLSALLVELALFAQMTGCAVAWPVCCNADSSLSDSELYHAVNYHIHWFHMIGPTQTNDGLYSDIEPNFFFFFYLTRKLGSFGNFQNKLYKFLI